MLNNVKEIEDLTISEVKKILSDKAKEKELNYEQKLALEHAKIFAKVTPAKAAKLKQELVDKTEVTSEVAAKITDILPNAIELDLIAEKNKCITEDNKKDILDLVEKYIK